MPLFPILETEALVQEQDKTRLDGTKAYAAAVNDITQTEIQPGESESFIDVSSDKFLDWEFDREIFDISLNVNDQVNFSEDGGTTELAGTIAPGSYSLTNLALALATALNGAGGQSYTVGVSGNKLTVSAPGNFELLGKSGTSARNVLAALGFDEDTSNKTSATGDEITQFPRTIYLRITNDASPTPDTETITRQLLVISETADMLFSSDDMLRKRETDILKYVPDGRSTWKDIHRQAQQQILVWLDTQGYIDDYGNKLVAKRFKDMTEVNEWSTMTALRLIMDSISVTIDDTFFKKARQYEKFEAFFRNRAVLRVDLNEDGKVDLGEQVSIQSARVVRR